MLEPDEADPRGFLRQAFLQGHGYDSREVLLAWLLSLGPRTDPASAARAVLTGLPERAGVPLGVELARVAEWPGERLADYARQRRRQLPS